MECKICNKEYKALGVHIRLGHKMDLKEYRDTFGLLYTAPLVDPYISDLIRASAHKRLEDPEYKETLTAQCLENTKLNKANPMSMAGKAALGERNKLNGIEYLKTKKGVVLDILKRKGTSLDVRREIGMGHDIVKKIGGYDLEAAVLIRKERILTTVNRRVAISIKHHMSYLEDSENTTDWLNKSGVSKSTHLRWIKKGLCPKHPIDGRLKR